MKTPISPKVIAAAIVGFILTAIVSNISAITPDMLDFLGPWKLFVLGTLLTLLTTLAAWWKTDPLRGAASDANAVPDSQALTAAVEASKQTSLEATALDAPVTVFPAARVDAALAAPEPIIEPVTVTPILPPTV